MQLVGLIGFGFESKWGSATDRTSSSLESENDGASGNAIPSGGQNLVRCFKAQDPPVVVVLFGTDKPASGEGFLRWHDQKRKSRLSGDPVRGVWFICTTGTHRDEAEGPRGGNGRKDAHGVDRYQRVSTHDLKSKVCYFCEKQLEKGIFCPCITERVGWTALGLLQSRDGVPCLQLRCRRKGPETHILNSPIFS